MTWLWAIFTFLNLWWIAAFIVIALQGQRTDKLRQSILYTSLLSAAITGFIALLFEQKIIAFV